ncbi:MAG: regulatory protein RecX [Streptosporangiaceae bacterium]
MSAKREGKEPRGRRRDDGPLPGRLAAEGPPGDPESVARSICLRLLTGAPRTRAQLADALRRRAVPDEVAERVLGRFSEVGLVDDEAFAQAWVQSRHSGRGLARRALAQELRRRGVASEAVDQAFETLGPEEEAETARALVRRKLPATARLESHVRFRRLVAMLARKGYRAGLAMTIVREELGAEGADTELLPTEDAGEGAE